MNHKKKNKPVFIISLLLYFMIAMEIVFMISPFAIYFFSVYGPILESMQKSPYLSWTTDFFLPHMTFPSDPLVEGLSYLQVLFIIGLLMFLAAALPLYYAKIFRKEIQMKWLYSRVRHPQYLAIAISGFGLLIYWPRFIILFFYVSMLFVYYFLARNEEWRMKRKFGAPYEQYMKDTPMFIPGEPGGRIYGALFGRLKPKWVGITVLYIICVTGSIAGAMALRSYAETRIPKYEAGNRLLVVPVFPRDQREVAELTKVALSDKRVRSLLTPDTNLAYLLPCDYFLMAIVTDEPRLFSKEQTSNYQQAMGWNRNKFSGGLGRFFKIFYNYTKAIGGNVDKDYEMERLIFVQVKDPEGNPVKGEDCLKAGFQRIAEVMVDIDAQTHRILHIKKLAGANKWGKAPMPAF